VCAFGSGRVPFIPWLYQVSFASDKSRPNASVMNFTVLRSWTRLMQRGELCAAINHSAMHPAAYSARYRVAQPLSARSKHTHSRSIRPTRAANACPTIICPIWCGLEFVNAPNAKLYSVDCVLYISVKTHI
jgi:hypothetical protein